MDNGSILQANKAIASRLVMIGAFPPPLHGMAAVNAAVLQQLKEAGATPQVINIAAANLKRSLSARLGRLPRVVVGLRRLAVMPGLRGGTLYMSVSGGLGQLYELAIVVLARSRGMRVYMHHHSSAYLDKPSLITRFLIRAAGCSACHVTQCQGMAERLKSAYRAVRVFPVSNAVFLLRNLVSTSQYRNQLRTLGFISNIAPEKGIFHFLDLAGAAEAKNLPIKAKLAGPFQDGETERVVRARLRKLRNVEYVGPKYGAEKDAFFAGIDVLIFPTANEAEGIVNHEAMSRGVPIIVYGRGCIPEIVGPEFGKVVDPAEPFVPIALAQLEGWLDSPASYQAASRAAVKRFSEISGEHERRWQCLLANLLGRNAKDAVSTVIFKEQS